MTSPARLDGIRRLDHGVARVEGAIAVAVLLAMVLVASAQALFFNIAERDVAWARAALDALSWADTFLQKGTLWLAFIGASLATHQDKHIAIDVLPKLSSARTATGMRAFAALGTGVIALLLGWVFYQACVVADAAVPFDYEVLTPDGPMHVCDAAAGAIQGTDRPGIFCALRSGLAAVGVPVSSGGGIAQLIAPVMFVVIGVRLLGRSVALTLSLVGSDQGVDRKPPAGDQDDDARSEQSGAGEDADGERDSDQVPDSDREEAKDEAPDSDRAPDPGDDEDGDDDPEPSSKRSGGEK